MKLSQRFSEALVYAVGLHADQQRKVSGTPYVAHLLRVAGIVLEHGGTEDEAIAALLHDAVEDQGGSKTLQEIRRRFGDAVATLVNSLSDTDQTPKPPWRTRKTAYLERLRNANRSVRLVAAADKLDNVRSLLETYRVHRESTWGHFQGGRDGTLWYFRTVVDVLRRTGGGPLVEELAQHVSELERLAADSPSNSP